MKSSNYCSLASILRLIVPASFLIHSANTLRLIGLVMVQQVSSFV